MVQCKQSNHQHTLNQDPLTVTHSFTRSYTSMGRLHSKPQYMELFDYQRILRRPAASSRYFFILALQVGGSRYIRHYCCDVIRLATTVLQASSPSLECKRRHVLFILRPVPKISMSNILVYKAYLSLKLARERLLASSLLPLRANKSSCFH